MKKRMLQLLLVGCMVFSLIGCSNSDKDGKKGDKISLTVMTRLSEGSSYTDYVINSLNQYGKDNNIDITVDNLPVEEDYLDKLRTNFANGDAPHVFTDYGGSRTLDYIESNIVEHMQPYLDEDKEWYDSFYPTFWDDLDYTEQGYEGIWGVPAKAYAVSLFYNKEIFDKQGLTPPKTFDELLAVCEKLKKANIKPFQCGAKDSYRLGHLHNNIVLKMYGADAVKKLADRKLSYDSPEMIKTYEVIKDMIDKGYLGEDLLATDTNTEKSAYLAGESAMRWDGDWFVPVLQESGDIYDKTGIIPFPYFEEKYKGAAQGGVNDCWFISNLKKSEEEIKASVDLVKYLTSKDFVSKQNEASASIYPINFEPTKDTPANPILDEIKKKVGEYEEMRTDIQVYDPATHMLDTVRNALQGLAMGNSPEQCGKEIVDRMKEYEGQ